MVEKEIKVKFETITPLWTGDAWQENKEIRPSSLIGSLRFWFEVICYFSGYCKKNQDHKHFNPQLGRFEKEVNRKDFRNCLANEGNSFEAKIKCLLEQKIPYPSIILGTTNWKSLIKIKEIKFDKNNFKEEPSGRIILNKNFFWGTPSYQGEFEVIFEVEEKIIEPIFYPLLTFMDKYGFWGGKWNIGYGRLKVSDIEENEDNIPREIWEKENFEFFKLTNSQLDKENINFSNFLKIENDFSSLLNINESNKKIKILLKDEVISNDLKETIKKLIEIKVKTRASFKENVELRHKIFGTTKPPPNNKNLLPQGSKIIPYIYRKNGSYKGGFISIVDLLT